VPHKEIGEIFKPALDQKRNFIIIKHEPKTAPNIPCEYDGLHYHGLAKQRGVDIRNERAWQRVKENIRLHNGWFKHTRVISLRGLCAYLQMPGKEVVLKNISDTLRETWDSITQEDIDNQVAKKTREMLEKKEKRDDINTLRQLMLESGFFTESELLHKYSKNETFTTIFKKKNFSHNMDKAKQLAAQYILEMSVEDLFEMAKKRDWPSDKYMSPEESVEVVKEWCGCQGIPYTVLVGDLYEFMDRKRKKTNTFWMHGQSNAGKSFIARSLQELAVLYHCVPPGSNRFMWQDCINKRLIVVNEPYLDEGAIEACKEIMEGNGAWVPVKNKPDQYLRPCPVLITSNTYLWAMNPQAKGSVLARVYEGYIDLKPAPFLEKINRELHPLWLDRAVSECIAIDYGVAEEIELPSIAELFSDCAPIDLTCKESIGTQTDPDDVEPQAKKSRDE
jgi:non-structural protein NS1